MISLGGNVRGTRRFRKLPERSTREVLNELNSIYNFRSKKVH
jgi:hypothetical protein